ncbi:MAG: hypothetical protein KBF75_12890, partial [Saprospiraceae bacterium]|nr:hypothetical protein [Saprospiraceae bacterium]
QKCRSGWLACFVAEGQRALPFPFDPFFGAVGKAISVMILGLHSSRIHIKGKILSLRNMKLTFCCVEIQIVTNQHISKYLIINLL